MTSLTRAQNNGHNGVRTGRPQRSSDAPAPLDELGADARLALLDDYWNAPILTEVLSGANRFRRMARNLQISSRTLSERLDALVDQGLLERRDWSEQDVEYRVSESGSRLLSIWVQRMRRRDVRASNGHGVSNGNGSGSAANGNGAHLELTDPAAERALALLGTRWNLLILAQLHLGRRRFTELKRALGITNRILTERLKQLADNEIIERRQYQASRYEFWLTPRGVALLPAITALFDWAALHPRQPSSD
jgi:DNA-binding HxlR family transcriptional regulator